MPTPAERLLGLAVARGLLEPGEAQGRSPEELIRSGHLSEADHRLLVQDLADLDGLGSSHWSLEDTAQVPAAEVQPGEATALSSGDGSGPSGASGGFSRSRVLRATTLDHWGRFETLELLGEGGMGRIFRAVDPRLRRTVALKLLRREDPDLLQRFLQEAQLQAQVDHPNVCRVYEVGEFRGQPYIAMQYLHGDTLQKAAPTLTLEALIHHMVEVCEGVHAAHRVGLVHRDLKPANLMLDRLEDGTTRACVLDFGLALGGDAKGLTETGRVMGTVAYMSPEQAAGHASTLDRRSDVYSLGATLYALLTGKPPFRGEGLECMGRILKEDPAPLRRHIPSVPADVETVVLTCLEKDPRRRYATARALGEDLQRILDGEPIQARPASALERTLRWARRRKALVAALLAVGISSLVFGGLAIRERLQARTRAVLTQQFAQEAERIEALARYLKLSPPHGLGPEQRALDARVAHLEAEVQAAGPLAEAPGQYALGRARLALGQPEAAQAHLERAHALGFDTPELRYALGRSLLDQHQRALDEAWRIQQDDARKEALGRLQARATARIEPLLRSGAAASLIPLAYLEGQAAWVAGRWEEAIAKARAAQAQAPWFYEAHLLEAQALLSWALPKTGPDRADILEAAYAQAQTALRAAPCDVQALNLAGRIGVLRRGLVASLPAQARLLRDALEGIGARLRILQPGSDQAALLEASLLTSEAIQAQLTGRPGATFLRRALDLLAPLLSRPQPSVEALQYAMEAEAYATKFPELGDPVPWLEQALAHGRQALELRPSHAGLASELARVTVWRLSAGIQRGVFPWEVFESSLGAVRRALEREPDAKSLRESLGYLWGERAEYERTHGLDPRASLDQSMRAFQAALALGPSFRSEYGLGNAALMRGQWEADHHQPGALANLELAERAYHRAQALAPLNPGLASTLVEVPLWKGRALGLAAPAGQAALAEAEGHFQEAVQRFPKETYLWLRGAQVAEAQGRLGEARARVARALALDPRALEVRALLRRLRQRS